jgi:bifunctional non-homologous end joining protein LigD
VHAADLPGARKTPQPLQLKPQRETVGEIPHGEDWLHEIKFDGYRMLCILSAGQARVVSRNGNDYTRKLARIAKSQHNRRVA